MNKIFLFALIAVSLVVGSCFPAKSILLGRPGKKDLNRFSSKALRAGNDCFEFAASASGLGKSLKVSDWTRDLPYYLTLEEFASIHDPRSLLVIQNDTVKFEFYGKGLGKADLHSSYSLAKSFVSVLIGIAIDEGAIVNEQQLVTDFLPEFKAVSGAESLSIEHLLDHTSGIKYSLALDGRLYYGRSILKALALVEFEHEPGTRQHYLNINAQLLGVVLERATGMSPAEYLEKKIWHPVQMCNDAKWSVDEKDAMEKTYCCLGATALDYAKFGRLMLRKGDWDGTRIFSEDWYRKSIARNDARGSSFNYNYSWHIGLKAYGDFMAIGLYKQHIYIHPDKKLVIVALNDRERRLKAERVNWWFIFRQIADQL